MRQPQQLMHHSKARLTLCCELLDRDTQTVTATSTGSASHALGWLANNNSSMHDDAPVAGHVFMRRALTMAYSSTLNFAACS